MDTFSGIYSLGLWREFDLLASDPLRAFCDFLKLVLLLASIVFIPYLRTLIHLRHFQISFMDQHSSLLQEFIDEGTVEDLDMLFLHNFPTTHLDCFLSGDVSLCNKIVHSRLTPRLMCCIIDHPVYIFVADVVKHRVAEKLLDHSNHSLLSVSAITGRFLATHTGRRIHAQAALDALLAARVKTVCVENYGQKSFINYYSDIFRTITTDCTFSTDLGLNVAASNNGHIPLLNVVSQEVAPDLYQYGRFIVRAMFTDLLSTEHRHAGTIEWIAASPVVIQHLGIVKIKVYPTYVHWLKLFPNSTSRIPATFSAMKKRINQLTVVLARLQQRTVAEGCTMRNVRIELTVEGQGSCNINEEAELLLPFLHHFCRSITVTEVAIDTLIKHARAWLDRAIASRVHIGAKGSTVPYRKKQHIIQLMNEFGFAHDAILTNLSNKAPSGRYPWEIRCNPPAAPTTHDTISEVLANANDEANIESTQQSDAVKRLFFYVTIVSTKQ